MAVGFVGWLLLFLSRRRCCSCFVQGTTEMRWHAATTLQAQMHRFWTFGGGLYSSWAVITALSCAILFFFNHFVLLATSNSIFLSHQISTCHQSPISQQYFSVTINQPQSPATTSRVILESHPNRHRGTLIRYQVPERSRSSQRPI